MGTKKDVQQLVTKLRKAGYDVRLTKNQHYAVSKPGGKTIFMPTTPSDRRGLYRVHQKLRNIGYDQREH